MSGEHMKKWIIWGGSFLIILAAGLYIWLAPPIGSKFYCWEDPESICESVVKDDVDIEFLELDYSKVGEAWFGVRFLLTNFSECDAIYDISLYRVDYLHFGRWKTVGFNLFPLTSADVCHGKEQIESAVPFGQEVISYPGKYRVYLKDVGFIEFEKTHLLPNKQLGHINRTAQKSRPAVHGGVVFCREI